jgi:hypothetical protein
MQGLGLVKHAGPDRSPNGILGRDVGERLPEAYGAAHIVINTRRARQLSTCRGPHAAPSQTRLALFSPTKKPATPKGSGFDRRGTYATSLKRRIADVTQRLEE